MYPQCYRALVVRGFVEELIVNDDPEHQWIDRIRPTRASNQARQATFARLSGELQRRLGVKALEMGGNAVVCYRQLFDLEGDSGEFFQNKFFQVLLHPPTHPPIQRYGGSRNRHSMA